MDGSKKSNLHFGLFPQIFFLWLIMLTLLNVFACSDKTQTSEAKNQTANEATNHVKPTMRIISQLPNITEICLALGLQKKLVGVTDFCELPENTKSIQKIGGIMNPDFELVLKLEPDLIILQNTLADIGQKYNQLGIKTLILKAHTTNDITSSIYEIGKATGHIEQAKKLNAKIDGQLKAVSKKAKLHEPIKTMLIIGHEAGSLKQIYAAGDDFFHGELLKIAGGENCITGSKNPYPQISAEELLNLSPEVIIFISAKALNKAERKKELELWQTLAYVKAVKNNRICILDKPGMFIPGIKIGNIAEDFYKCLYK